MEDAAAVETAVRVIGHELAQGFRCEMVFMDRPPSIFPGESRSLSIQEERR